MHKVCLLLLLLFVSLNINAQAPQKMSYQAVIRNQYNALLSNTRIAMKISIIQGDTLSSPIYSEYQVANTNINGLVTLQIGTGIAMLGDFTKINWSKSPYYIKTETDPDGGLDFRITGTSELMSVPYALYAANSNFDTTTIYKSLNKLEIQSIKNKNDIQINLDSLKSNVIQTQISVKNIAINTNDIEKNLDSIQKNTIDIKTNLDTLNSKINSIDLNTILKDYQKLGKFVSAISLQGVDSFDVNINGNFIASKNVTIGGNIESLGATSTLGTLEKPFKGLFISSGSLSIASDTLGKDIPAAVLSNVEGNLQISAGGLKLMGDNTSFIAPRIVSTLTGNASSATKLDTARKINGILFDGSKDIIIATTSANALTYTNTGTGDVPGGSYNGSLAKSISYNSIGASPLAGSSFITTLGTLTAGSIPFTLLTGTVPIWNQSTLGNAATVTTNANLTGIVTSVGNVTSIASGTITNSMIANTAVANLTGTNTGDQILPTLISLGGVAINTAITGATKTKITYDVKGLVTAGAEATTADIAASTNKNYVTDVQAGVISNTSGTNTGDQTNITGNAATVTTNANLTGIVTSLGNVTSIASGTITNSMLANTAVANLSGTNTGDQTNITGNAGTATKLENTRLINGVTFDGSSDITITAVANAGTLSGTALNGTIVNSSLRSLGTLGNLTVTNPIVGSITGNAASVTTNANLTGVVTSVGNVTSIASGTITNSMLANTAVENLSGTKTGDQTNITGNAGTATKLATTKLINGVAFDGSSDITITAVADAGTLSGTILNPTIVNSSLTSVGTLSNLTVTNPITGSVTGNAATATTATTAGTASTVTTNANLTGVVTSLGNVTSIASGTITNSMLANTAVANLSGTNTGDQTSVTGNAGTATKLAATKLINGVAFDGTSDISITAIADAGTLSGTTLNASIINSSLTSLGTLGNLNVSGIITGTLSGTSNNVSGIVAIANGGTNSTAIPTAGGINYGTGTAQAYTSVGTSGQYLQSTGTGTPIWSQPGPSRILLLTSLTPNSIYTVSANVKVIMVELIGGGGGSGGSIVAGGGKGSASGGGGSGTYTRLLITSPTTSYTYTIGIGGTAGASSGTLAAMTGGAGGQTSFINGSNTVTAPGGSGGVGGFVLTTNNGFLATDGGQGGLIGANGDFSIQGNGGGIGFVMSTIAIGGVGAHIYFGGGSLAQINTTGQTGIANNATSFGSGASGASVLNAAAEMGGTGYQGVIIITEYK